MKTTILDTKKFSESLDNLMDSYNSFYWAVAWGTISDKAEKLFNNQSKIKSLLIGIDFYQTHPDFLSRTIECKRIKVATDICSGTYHPKVYYFESGDNAAAIIGSGNFTYSAVTKNVEIGVLLEGKKNDAHLSEIKGLVSQLYKKGSAITKEFLVSYNRKYEATKKQRRELSRKVKVKVAKSNAPNPELLSLSFDEYVELVKSNDRHNLQGRIGLLNKAQTLFRNVSGFNQLGIFDRQAIAGVLKSQEGVTSMGDNFDWGWFGTMANGDFANRINTNHELISLALEHIPLSGEILKENYDEYINLIVRAFEDASHKVKIPTASRLLALKRPDTFVCLNSKNITGLSKDFRFARTTLNFEKYWAEIIEPIRESNWFTSMRAYGEKGKIWDYRVALLDTVYYVP